MGRIKNSWQRLGWYHATMVRGWCQHRCWHGDLVTTCGMSSSQSFSIPRNTQAAAAVQKISCTLDTPKYLILIPRYISLYLKLIVSVCIMTLDRWDISGDQVWTLHQVTIRHLSQAWYPRWSVTATVVLQYICFVSIMSEQLMSPHHINLRFGTTKNTTHHQKDPIVPGALHIYKIFCNSSSC